jgi:ankyrin repeat protein
MSDVEETPLLPTPIYFPIYGLNKDFIDAVEYFLMYPLDQYKERLPIFILEKGADVNSKYENGETVLMSVVRNVNQRNEFIDFIKLLLEKRADPNIPDKDGQYPLFEITLNNGVSNHYKLEIITELLNHGADPELLDNSGKIFTYIVDIYLYSYKKEIENIIEKNKVVNLKPAKR